MLPLSSRFRPFLRSSRHSRADTTADEYLQALPGSVKEMVGSVYELFTKSEQAQAEGAESATKLRRRTDAERALPEFAGKCCKL
jgi:hypothetical protein